MKNPLRLLSKLRRFPKDGNPGEYLATEYRQNLKAIEDAFNNILNALNGVEEELATTATPGVNQVTFTSNGSFVVPDGVRLIQVAGCGGGSGGSYASGGNALGGWGAPWTNYSIEVTPGASYDIAIGAGGAGGVAPNGAGVDGNASTFGTALNTICSFLAASPTNSVGYAGASPFFNGGNDSIFSGVTAFGSGAGPYGTGVTGVAANNNFNGNDAGVNTGAGGGSAAAFSGSPPPFKAGDGGSGKIVITYLVVS